MPQLRQTHAHTLKEKGGKKTLTKRMKRRIKQELSTEKPTIWIGKEGATAQTNKRNQQPTEKTRNDKSQNSKNSPQRRKSQRHSHKSRNANKLNPNRSPRTHIHALQTKKKERRSPLTLRHLRVKL